MTTDNCQVRVGLISFPEKIFGRPASFIFIDGSDCTMPFFSKEIGRVKIAKMCDSGQISSEVMNSLVFHLNNCSLPESEDVFDRCMAQVVRVSFIEEQFFIPIAEAAKAGDLQLAVNLNADLCSYLKAQQLLNS